MKEKSILYLLSDKFNAMLIVISVLLSCLFTFLCVPSKAWMQYKISEPTQISLTSLGEKNSSSKYSQITVDHLEIDGKSNDIPEYVESGKWNDDRNDLTWEDNKGYTGSIVLNIPSGGERKVVFSTSIYRGLVKIEYDGQQIVLDCYSPNDYFYKFDISGDARYGAGILYILKLLCVVFVSIIIFCIFKKLFEYIGKHFKNISNWDIIALLWIFLFSLFCVYSNTDSPWSQLIPWTDSDNFIYIGWSMSKGQIPYVDFFDHKGLYFFFIECLGYRLTNSYVGIWILEWLSVFIAQLLSYFTIRKYTNFAISLFGVVIGYTYTIFYLSSGNYIETFTMPWIALGIYLLGEYFDKKPYQLNNLQIFILGVSFMIAMMMRQNSTGIWFVGCYFIVMHQLAKNRYINILRYGLIFLFGAFVAFLPGLIYLVINNALKEFIETYWIFNFKYVAGGVNKLHAIKYFGLTLLGIVVVAGAGLSIINRKKLAIYSLRITMYYCLYGFSLLFTSMSGYTWQHYAVIMLPLFPIGLLIFITNINILYNTLSSSTVKTILNCILGFLIIGFLFDKNGNLLRGIAGMNMVHYNSHNRYTVKVVSRRIREKTNKDQKISVIGNFGAYYWLSERLSISKYFYQNPLVSVNSKIKDKYLDDIKEGMPAAIVVGGTDFLEEYGDFGNEINDFLNSNYVMDYNQEKQQLYFRKDIVQ